MGRPKDSIALKAGDRWSKRWPGHIRLQDGRFRKPTKWREKCTNVYSIQTHCTKCKGLMLQATKHAKAGSRPFCCQGCKSSFLKTQDQGRRYLKKADGQQEHYILVRAHGHSRCVQGKVREHLLIMEKKIGRPVSRIERVHHVDFVKSNNAPANLFLCASNAEHLAAHHSLNHCVAALLASGALAFDEQQGIYYVPHCR